MAPSAFAHLHAHSYYSLLDGVASASALIARAREFGMESLALTDHGNMFGCVEFHLAALKAGIRPVLGFEAYIAKGSRLDRGASAAIAADPAMVDYLGYAHGGADGDAGALFGGEGGGYGGFPEGPAPDASGRMAAEPGIAQPEPDGRLPGMARKNAANHLILLAETFEGYQNLSSLCTAAYLDGFYFVPRIDKELLREKSRGVICLSACLSGEIPELILAGDVDGAERCAREFRDIFGPDNFFLEIQRANLPEQERILGPMREISRRAGIPLVATSDVHYLNPDDFALQDVLICIGTRKTLSDERRMHGCPDLHLKSPEAMAGAFPDFPDAVERSAAIASRCDVKLPLPPPFVLPTLVPPVGKSAADYFDELCRRGLAERYGSPVPAPAAERYEKERDVIARMGFIDYFLIVWDMVSFARREGIWVGPGRGSAAGSVVSYALRITDIDPLKYQLYFERFLNVGRNEMPDIDLDFDIERRGEIYDYLIKTHGREKCAKIATFGCLSAKSGIRDVGRVLAYPLSEVDKLSKLFNRSERPGKGENPVAAALRTVPELRELRDGDPMVRRILDTAARLEGVPRQTGIHAAGMVVCPRPIREFGPLAALPRDPAEIFTQFDMDSVSKLGLCKIDVLGLETLTIIRKTLDRVRERRGQAPNPEDIPLDDAPTFALLGRGDAIGVFQFESEGFRGLMTQLKPDRFEDLIAAVAIYRPGPMGHIPSFIARKHGRERIAYAHPSMEPILAETYGILLYQEQVQALAQDLARFTLSEGDLMRRAMGKKKKDEMDSYRTMFVERSSALIGKAVAERLFEDIAKFAEYAFNKAHSACYALLAYQTAWLKANHPREFLAAMLTANAGRTDKLAVYIEEARGAGVPVLPPDVNESGSTFTVAGDAIRFGLAGVKGVGEKAVETLADERRAHGPYKGLFDLCGRVDGRSLNKGALEALAKAGAFDSFGGHRAQYVAALDRALGAGQKEQRDRNAGLRGLFDEAAEAREPELPKVPAWPDREKLTKEKEAIGFFITSHPLSLHARRLKAFATHTTAALAEAEEREPVILGGLVTGVRPNRTTQNGKSYWQVTLEDLYGSVDVQVYEHGVERDPATLEEAGAANGGRRKFGARTPLLERVKGFLEIDKVLYVIGTVGRRDGKAPMIFADDIVLEEQADAKLARVAVLSLGRGDLDDGRLEALRQTLAEHPGPARVLYRIRTGMGATAALTGDDYPVRPGPALTAAVEKALGPGRLSYRRKLSAR